MTAQKGRDLLLKTDSSGTGSFTTVAGLRTHALSFNAQTVDITHAESAGAWRELLAGAGIKSASIRGQGLFKDDASDVLVRQFMFDGTIRDWQVIIPDFGTVSGPFQVTALEYSGQHDGELTFELALESAGLLSFAAA
ncbi:phage major tail protein, TP901-1 family [Kaustia mangrovi]|uniref:Phage major tail protein, TP901-1 family n=1 Tax=Kaustia mangrovi TaxID=2593653 RepID=A0A7S8C251_9HYPH|nr:phage major tail protein, TP901-1 family [Kaustia mangrovi]QPC41993.1 phage major tail protein, TP901-1 family [Kaustia mangrovi]